MNIRLGFLGNGNMGYAILKGLVDGGVLKAEETAVYDPSEAARRRAELLGSQVYENERALAEACPVVLAAVKPQMAAELFGKIGAAMKDKLLVSIVAGFEVKRIREALGTKSVRVLRVMPNTPAMVGAGVFGLDIHTDARPEEKEEVADWLGSLGIIEWTDESLFPVITALSGGGPAFVAMFVEALADGGVKYGLKRDAALKIAEQTVYGSAKLLLEGGDHPAVLKDKACSPAGTTIAGVEALEESAFRAAVMKAVGAATEKALKL